MTITLLISLILLTSCMNIFANLIFSGDLHFDEFVEGVFESDDECVLAHPFTIENEEGTSIHYDDLIITKTRLVLEKDIYGITRGENTKWENAIENYHNYEEYRFELYMQINKSDYYKINLNFYSINNVTNTYFGRLEYDSYFKTSVDTRIIFYYNFEENEYILSFTEDRTKWYLEFGKTYVDGKLNENEKNYITFKINNDSIE